MAAVVWLKGGKSAKQLVNELSVKLRAEVTWWTEESEPKTKPSTFYGSCVFVYKGVVYLAESDGKKSKQEAEQQAASIMLVDKLKTVSKEEVVDVGVPKRKEEERPMIGATATTAKVSEEEEKEIRDAKVNPISELTMICQKLSLDPPDFQNVSYDGPPHLRMFTMSCSIPEYNLTEIACRPNKKSARTVAAHRILKQMKEMGLSDKKESTSAPGPLELELVSKIDWKNEIELHLRASSERNQMRLNEYGNKMDVLMSPEGFLKKMANDYRVATANLKKSKTMYMLMSKPGVVNKFNGPFQLLESICKESEIKVSHSFCMMKPSTNITVFLELKQPRNVHSKSLAKRYGTFGYAETKQDALNSAARKALKELIENFSDYN